MQMRGAAIRLTAPLRSTVSVLINAPVKVIWWSAHKVIETSDVFIFRKRKVRNDAQFVRDVATADSPHNRTFILKLKVNRTSPAVNTSVRRHQCDGVLLSAELMLGNADADRFNPI